MKKYEVFASFESDINKRELYGSYVAKNLDDLGGLIYADWLSNEIEPDESQYMDDWIKSNNNEQTCNIYSGEGELEARFYIKL